MAPIVAKGCPCHPHVPVGRVLDLHSVGRIGSRSLPQGMRGRVAWHQRRSPGSMASSTTCSSLSLVGSQECVKGTRTFRHHGRVIDGCPKPRLQWASSGSPVGRQWVARATSGPRSSVGEDLGLGRGRGGQVCLGRPGEQAGRQDRDQDEQQMASGCGTDHCWVISSRGTGRYGKHEPERCLRSFSQAAWSNWKSTKFGGEFLAQW